MIRLSLVLTVLVAAGVLPATHALSAKQEPRTVARTLLAQANSGPAGQITRQVTCNRTSKARQTFKCDLDSVRSTRIGAHVAVANGGLSISWQPIEG